MRVIFIPLVCVAALAGCNAKEAASAAPPPAQPSLPRASADAPATGAAGPQLSFPLACEVGVSCEVQHYVDRDPGPAVLDYHCGRRSYDGHNGIDIRLLDMAAQRQGVDVLAAAAGRVSRLRDGVQDISIRAAGAPSVANMECGNGVVVDHGDGWETQYCHLAQGSVRVTQGQQVSAGQPIARVGLSGNTEFPHLHITVRHNMQIVDPFAPDPAKAAACGAQPSLWTPTAATAMAYKAGAILNAGFTGDRTSMDAIEAGGVPAFDRSAPFVVLYARAIEVEAGDQLQLSITGPDGATLVSDTAAPLANDRAQQFQLVGKRQPPGGWAAGEYRGVVAILRKGKAVASRTVSTRL